MSFSKIFQRCFSWVSDKSPAQILFIVVFLESLAIVLAIWRATAAGYSPQAFFKEGEYMTILSCLQLLGSAVVARKIFLLAKSSSNSILNNSSSFWHVVSFGLFFLTLDDALGIHEYIDKLLHSLLDIQETALTDLADDATVGGYLLFFLIYAIRKWHSIQLFRSAFVYFRLGCILTVVMVIFDAASNNRMFVSMLTDNPERASFWQTWFSTFEDSVKIYAEGLFFIGVYKCWRIAKALNNRINTKIPLKFF